MKEGSMSARKSIGFIDYFIDNWHSQNYPQFIRESKLGEKFEVTLAWEQIHASNGMHLDEFCAKHKIAAAASLDQVVQECDCLVVLAPRNPEKHEELAELALRSGKPVYIDKTFAPSAAAAARMFDKAQKHDTPMFSSSALRFGSELQKALRGPLAGQRVSFVSTIGGGEFAEYAVHQLEMVVAALGVGAERVMQCGTADSPMLVIDYPYDRRASITLIKGHRFGFSAAYGLADSAKGLVIDRMDDFFPLFIDAMLTFFETRQSPVPSSHTIEIMALLEAGLSAMKKPDRWVKISRP
jgi:predicted dehydrogenase